MGTQTAWQALAVQPARFRPSFAKGDRAGVPCERWVDDTPAKSEATVGICCGSGLPSELYVTTGARAKTVKLAAATACFGAHLQAEKRKPNL